MAKLCYVEGEYRDALGESHISHLSHSSVLLLHQLKGMCNGLFTGKELCVDRSLQQG